MTNQKSVLTRFFSFFNTSNKHSNNKHKSDVHKQRHMKFEQLEDRRLLSVSMADYNAIREAYPDFDLPAATSGVIPGNINIIEVNLGSNSSATNLTNLKSAIKTASSTAQSDLIVVRTNASNNTIKYTSNQDEIVISNVVANQYGSITIVGWGTENLTLDANQKCRVMTVSGENVIVNLGGLTITDGYAQNGLNAKKCGGGIYNENSTLTIEKCTFNKNSVIYGKGGAIYPEYFTR